MLPRIHIYEQRLTAGAGEFNCGKTADIRCLVVLILSLLSCPSFSGSNSEYGDIIKNTPEYEKITTPNNEDDSNEHFDHNSYHGPYYHPVYPLPYAYYHPSNSGRVRVPGAFYVGVTIGESKFDYDDSEDGDSSIFRFGYRPSDSRLGYELSIFDSGNSEITSLNDIELHVDTINFSLTVNSSRRNSSRLNLLGQGGIYFADTTLTGPFSSVSVNSNGFFIAVGIEIMLNRHFRLRAEASSLFDVEDFANDKSISSLNLGGSFVF